MINLNSKTIKNLEYLFELTIDNSQNNDNINEVSLPINTNIIKFPPVKKYRTLEYVEKQLDKYSK